MSLISTRYIGARKWHWEEDHDLVPSFSLGGLLLFRIAAALFKHAIKHITRFGSGWKWWCFPPRRDQTSCMSRSHTVVLQGFLFPRDDHLQYYYTLWPKIALKYLNSTMHHWMYISGNKCIHIRKFFMIYKLISILRYLVVFQKRPSVYLIFKSSPLDNVHPHNLYP